MCSSDLQLFRSVVVVFEDDDRAVLADVAAGEIVAGPGDGGRTLFLDTGQQTLD